jgi:SAM-dependent methyltransferase
VTLRTPRISPARPRGVFEAGLSVDDTQTSNLRRGSPSCQQSQCQVVGGDASYGTRIAILLVGVFFVAPALFVGYQAVRTLQVLTSVELERDTWQRPSDVLRWLNVGPGGVVVDLGCGAGYFALKLSVMVGADGQVLAEDIRRESLAFLWIRRFLKDARNVRVILGEIDDPHLPTGPIDAVLIANTYHELDRPSALLALLFRAMRPGARLVVLDRGPRTNLDGNPGEVARPHELRPGPTAGEIQQSGFELVERDDRFIDRPGEEGLWWLIVARKP